MAIKMELKGLRELLAAMRKVAPESRREFTASLKVIGKMVVGETQAPMPRRKGAARRSVKVKIVTRRRFEGVETSEGGPVAPYVPWLDFGGTVGRGRRTTVRLTVGGGRVRRQTVGSR